MTKYSEAALAYMGVKDHYKACLDAANGELEGAHETHDVETLNTMYEEAFARHGVDAAYDALKAAEDTLLEAGFEIARANADAGQILDITLVWENRHRPSVKEKLIKLALRIS